MRRLQFQVTGITEPDLREWSKLQRGLGGPAGGVAIAILLLAAAQAITPPRTQEPLPGWLRGVARAGTPLDLVIVFDTSSSMGRAIGSLRESAVETVHRLRQQSGDLRLGLVRFSDFADGPNAFSASPLSGDIEAQIEVIRGWSAAAGGDAPEDLYAGLRTGLEMPWRRGVTRVILAITDAPPHDPDRRGDTAQSIAGLARDSGFVRIFLIIVGRNRQALDAAWKLAASTGGVVLTAADHTALAKSLLDAVQP